LPWEYGSTKVNSLIATRLGLPAKGTPTNQSAPTQQGGSVPNLPPTNSNAEEPAFRSVDRSNDGPAPRQAAEHRRGSRLPPLDNVSPVPPTESVAVPTIPAQQPAAIEPEWSNGVLRLRKGPVKTDLKGRQFSAALRSLKAELHAFDESISAETNIDRRFVSFVLRLAEQVPTRTPSQQALFRLGHGGDVLRGYANVINEQWSPLLAAQFHAVSLYFENTMRQAPLWRQFRRNAEQEALTPEQVAGAALLAVDAARALRGDEAATFVDAALPEALEQMAQPLAELAVSVDAIEDGKELLALDLVESVSNILKRVAEAALGVAAVVNRVGTGYISEYKKGIIAKACEQGKADGARSFVWLRRLVLVGGAASVGLPTMFALYPNSFRWLGQVFQLLKSLGGP